MNNTKNFFRLAFHILTLSFVGCTTANYYPPNFVESLKHPTKFPEVFTFTVQNVEEIADKNSLGKNEEVKITAVGENKNSSMFLVQVRENGELHPHYHKRHDEIIYVKKGSGIATLDGARYVVKPGSILQIPSKTVHKFLNTGGELFLAVSIFSPPFDGKDEKLIKEKKKREKNTKEEKRLATKKPENVTVPEEKKTSAVKVKEPTESKIQTANYKSEPENVAEEKLNKPVHEKLDTNIEKSLPPPENLLASEGKKKSKETISTEEHPINIKDLHEKLTKLLELKEEGTISEEEYEKKKDLLVSGEDIGELPESKSYVRKKSPLEDKPILKQTEKYVPLDENIPNESQDTLLSTPRLSHETESAAHEVASEEKELTSEDKLKLLEEMKQEGLISDEDYESKKEAIAGVKEKTVSSPIENASIEKKGDENKTEDIMGTDEEKTTSTPFDSVALDEKIKELKELYNEGLITEDDYKYKLKELPGAQTRNLSPDVSTEKRIENDKLSELNELKEEGLISDEDYAFKKAQLLGK